MYTASTALLLRWVPPLRPDSRQSWFKDRARKSWDFALASAAIYAVFQGSKVTDSRIVLGGVDVKPRRSEAAEQVLKGNSPSDNAINRVGEASIEEAAPFTNGTGNEFRIEILKGVIRKALRALTNSSVKDNLYALGSQMGLSKLSSVNENEG